MDDSRLDDARRRLNLLAEDFLSEQARRASQAQSQYLNSRLGTMRQMGELLRLQAGLAANPAQARPPLFNRELLEEFASGSVERCLGAEYAVFRGRRIPRIPNGMLLLMDRVVEVCGTRGQLDRPSEIVTEYDVPADAWFYRDCASRPEEGAGSCAIPYVILMEMALQPCGFLSAYLGTILISPNCSLFFRNLDGEARLLRQPDLRGQRVTGWARMTAHTVNEETVIQKFEFSLSTGGEPFYVGNSVFGFFPGETMARQVGLDGGKASQPLFLQPGGSAMQLRRIALQQAAAAQTGLHLAGGHLALLDEVLYDPTGGAAGRGYIYASRQISPDDWFFRNHFFQDPVMPGSLGVEAVLEALRAFAMAEYSTECEGWMGAETAPVQFELSDSMPFFWKYRGQVMPDAGKMQLEIQVLLREESAHGIEIMGDASLWAGSIRIYLLKNLAIRIVKG